MTDRQSVILETIVESYAEISSPVGSVALAKLFDVSSSTIRNEMSVLEKKGYIQQPHTSAGRIPTDKGYRWYVNRIQGEQMPQTDQFKALDTRIKGAGEPQQAIISAIESLTELTSNVGIGTLGRHLHTSGLSSLFNQPEFHAPQPAQAVAYLLDNLDLWLKEVNLREPLGVFIGAENPIGKTSGCSLIISRFRTPYTDNGYIGILGSTRQNYKRTISLVKHTGQILEETL